MNTTEDGTEPLGEAPEVGTTVRIVDQRTGQTVKGFPTYVAAADYRRDVLRPALRPDQPCPYAIRGVPA